MCHYGDNLVGILVMKHYKLGSIYNYEWNESNFSILKNIIKQVIFAIIYAYETIGFIHGDLHSGNVLLKDSKKCYIEYEKHKLEVNKLEVIIMDFEKSKISKELNIYDLIKNINKFITSIIYSNNMKLHFEYIELINYNNLILFNTEISYYDKIDIIIEKLTIKK